MHYKGCQVENFGRVAGYGAWPAKISKVSPSQTVTVSGNVTVTSPVCSQELLYNSAPMLETA